MTEDRARLILSCVHWDQFIFLIAEDDPMRCPRDGPLRVRGGIDGGAAGGGGAGVAFREHDDRVDLIDLHMPTTRRSSRSTRSTCGTCCPMMCEVQWWEFPS